MGDCPTSTGRRRSRTQPRQEDDRLQDRPAVGATAKTRKGGGCGRCWAEWAELWSAAAEWIMLSVPGGDVAVVDDTLFEALWAAVMLSRLIVSLIVDKDGKFQIHRNPDVVYM
ncbi:hypothetical protein LZ31DRAFT_598649 [Colletotrichum somersetense]|nr:hypothetical protein LZ31DRAFT_598649 [Colletotrichum somersetense]